MPSGIVITCSNTTLAPCCDAWLDACLTTSIAQSEKSMGTRMVFDGFIAHLVTRTVPHSFELLIGTKMQEVL
jgi:hypothetical protein